MHRERFSTSAGPADFPGALVQLTRPKQVFLEHVDYPNQASLHRRMLSNIISVLNSFITVTRSSIATRVNEAGLIETVPIDQARMDYDPIPLTQKGLLSEEERTNLFNNFNFWVGFTLRSVVTTTSDFSIFASGQVAKITGSGAGTPVISSNITLRSGARTFNCFVRRDATSFVQFHGANDSQFLVNYDLATGTIGTIGTSVSSASIQPWRDGWYRCITVTSSTTLATLVVAIVSSASAVRA